MSALSIRSRPTLGRITCANAAAVQGRLFSASTANAISLQIEKNDPEAVANVVPAYPYGPARWYKQSNRGLYGGQKIQFGNNIGETFEVKTRRSWHPNVRTKNLYSKALGRPVQVRVTTRTLRTIDKVGGLDEYLLGGKEARIRELGESGWWLRWAIMQTPAVKKRYAEERKRLGVADLEDAANAEEAAPELVTATAEETQAAMELGEEVASDGAFEVDGSSSLPPLKFRVGRGAHLILTPKGWRRTRPDFDWMTKSITRHLQKTTGYQRLAAVREKIEHMSAEQLLQARPVGKAARGLRRVQHWLAAENRPAEARASMQRLEKSLSKRVEQAKVEPSVPLDELKQRRLQRAKSTIQRTLVTRSVRRVQSIRERRLVETQQSRQSREVEAAPESESVSAET